VGIRGSLLTLYYAEISKMSQPEKTMVDLIRIPLDQCQKLLESHVVETTAVTMLGVAWFLTMKHAD